LKEGDFVVLDADIEFETDEVTTKILKTNRIQILQDEHKESFAAIFGRKTLTENKPALPEHINIEYKIKVLVKDIYKKFNGTLPLSTVLEQVRNENPDLITSQIFKYEFLTSKNKSFKKLSEELENDEDLMRVGSTPIRFAHK
jgi:hypothetical protein